MELRSWLRKCKTYKVIVVGDFNSNEEETSKVVEGFGLKVKWNDKGTRWDSRN